MTTSTKTTRGLIITVRNYDYYQTPKNYEDHNEDATKTQRRPSSGVTIYKNEEEEEDKKEHKEPPFRAVVFLSGLGIDKQISSDFLKNRKTKGLANTKTAFIGLKREIEKSGLTPQAAITKCCEMGWGGFKASWLGNEGTSKVNGDRTEDIAARLVREAQLRKGNE
jgi:hypothetical protein